MLSSKKIWGAKREVRFLIFNPTNSTIHLTGSFNHLFTRHIIQAAYVRRCRKWQKRLFNIFCFRTCRAHQRCYFDSTMAVIMCVIKVKEHKSCSLLQHSTQALFDSCVKRWYLFFTSSFYMYVPCERKTNAGYILLQLFKISFAAT